MYDRLKNLISPLFLFCLLLLIFNDFYLKATFHNILTGKLSDFCGLFIFPIFWSAIFPRHKLSVFIITGVMFIYWKSEYATGLIDLINTFTNIQRTVDPTDLIALPVLFGAWIYLKGDPVAFPANSLIARLSTGLIGLVTIFSFCATSQQRYIQSFDQPHYVLLQASKLPDSAAYEEFKFYKTDSFLVVQIIHLYINKPVRDDDYNKNRSLVDLDQDVKARVADSTSLIPVGKITTLAIETDRGKDALRFNGGRLDGRFTRTKNNKLIIEGFYKMGIEDSTWTFSDTSSTDKAIYTFVNGERTNVKHFQNNKLISSTSINTRADTIRNFYIKIGIMILFITGIILWLIKNYRSTYPEQLKLNVVWKWLLCFISPFFIWLSHAGIKILLMNYNNDVFDMLATIIFIFLVACPLMFFIVFLIKLRKEIDVLLYWLLLGLACSIWTTCGTLIELS